jgi:predicted kinase
VKLHVTVGLPRSGKTTWARSTGFPIVNPDSVRLALHGQRFLGMAEPMVWAVTFAMVESLRLAGHEDIVVDATNVSAKRRKEWTDRYGPDVRWKVINTPAEECIRRALADPDPYYAREIIPVIERMAREWDFARSPEEQKIRTVLDAVRALEGVPVRYSAAKKLAEAARELREELKLS